MTIGNPNITLCVELVDQLDRKNLLGAIRSLECVRAGLNHAKAKGKHLGRPKKPVDAAKELALRT